MEKNQRSVDKTAETQEKDILKESRKEDIIRITAKVLMQYSISAFFS